MAITYRGANNPAGEAAGSAAASTVAITPTLPTGAAAGDRIWVVQCYTRNASLGATPTGWNLMGTGTVGTGTQASGSGVRGIAYYFRDYDGVWTMPAFSLTSVANNSHWIGAVAVTPTSGSFFSYPTLTSTKGVFNTAGTAYTWTSSSGFSTVANAFLVIGSCFNDNITSTTVGVTQTGATFGTVTERCDGGTGTGHIVAGKVHTASVTTGASGAITHTLTLSAASQGESVFIEQTESVPGAAFSTFSDNFNTGSTPDAAKWSSPGSPTLVSGTLSLPFGTTLQSISAYNLVGNAAYVQAKTQAASSNFYLIDGSGGGYGWTFDSSSVVEVSAMTGLTGVTRTHTSGDWYRVRESGGTIFYDYSTNGTTWTNLYSESIVGYFNVHNTTVLFENDSASTVTFDNFNTVPAATNTGAFFAMF
jgi:hypothetical protein